MVRHDRSRATTAGTFSGSTSPAGGGTKSSQRILLSFRIKLNMANGAMQLVTGSPAPEHFKAAVSAAAEKVRRGCVKKLTKSDELLNYFIR